MLATRRGFLSALFVVPLLPALRPRPTDSAQLAALHRKMREGYDWCVESMGASYLMYADGSPTRRISREAFEDIVIPTVRNFNAGRY